MRDDVANFHSAARRMVSALVSTCALMSVLCLTTPTRAGDPGASRYAEAAVRSASIEQLLAVPLPAPPAQLVGLETGGPEPVDSHGATLRSAAPATADVSGSDWLVLMHLGPDASAAPAEPAPPLSPAKAAFKVALEKFVAAAPAASRYHFAVASPKQQRQAVAAYYAAHDFAPLWVKEDRWTAAARSVMNVVAQAGEDGLDLAPYSIPGAADAAPGDTFASELALSEAVAEYGLEASGGRIDATRLSTLIATKANVARARSVLDLVSGAADPGGALRGYNPPQAAYAALRQKLAELRERAPVARAPFPAGPTLKLGMRDPRVSLIRARFGIAPTASRSEGFVYDPVVASAVADFQRSKGLPASGVLNVRTVAALSAGRSVALENEILANMERWRWMPREMGATRIEVNIPDFGLKVYRDDAVVHEARVVVGKPETPTPVFSDSMRYVTVNPSWWVPQSIIQKELLPRAAADPSYLRRSGYEVFHRGNSLLVRQPPGDRNALGHMLFMFPNRFAVYLHDTPSRGLFSTAKRAYSHGCVRVDQPFKLAEMVLGADAGWTEERLRKLMGPQEKTVSLHETIPIHLMYFTATVDAADRLVVRGDVYGYSKRVRTALGLEG